MNETYTTENDSDSLDFLHNVEKIIYDSIMKWKPQDLFITRVDNWFDYKWLKFSGTVMHEIAISKLIELTIPPFHPNRIESCDKYICQNKAYLRTNLDKELHIFQMSADNLKRKIADFSTNGLFIWFSSNSKVNNNGSFMLYLVCDNECFAFYASLTLEQNWRVKKSVGLTKKQIDSIIA